MQQHLADKNIALDLARVTEAAALGSSRFIGKGDKDDVRKAAVDAMRIAFQSIHIRGLIVVGGGEPDEAPMFYNGAEVGYGDGPEMDVAVDPVDGVAGVAFGRHNSISSVGIARKGALFNPGHSKYCQKIVVGKNASGVIDDMDMPLKDMVAKVARAAGKSVNEVNIFVLDRKRNTKIAQDARITGARVYVHRAGDIAGALMAADDTNDMDMLLGIGGTAEAIVTACGLKGSGGQMLIRLAPQSDEERKAIEADGIDINAVRSLNELVTSDECFFAFTGITPGELLDGVRYKGEYAITSSCATRGRTGTRRYIQAWHDRKKLSKMSTIVY